MRTPTSTLVLQEQLDTCMKEVEVLIKRNEQLKDIHREEVFGLEQEIEHYEMNTAHIENNLFTLCDEVDLYRSLWVIKLYNWIKRIDLPSLEDLRKDIF